MKRYTTMTSPLSFLLHTVRDAVRFTVAVVALVVASVTTALASTVPYRTDGDLVALASRVVHARPARTIASTPSRAWRCSRI
jgi:hypothetical protein